MLVVTAMLFFHITIAARASKCTTLNVIQRARLCLEYQCFFFIKNFAKKYIYLEYYGEIRFIVFKP